MTFYRNGPRWRMWPEKMSCRSWTANVEEEFDDPDPMIRWAAHQVEKWGYICTGYLFEDGVPPSIHHIDELTRCRALKARWAQEDKEEAANDHSRRR